MEKDFKIWKISKSIINVNYGERKIWAKNLIQTIREKIYGMNLPDAELLVDLLEKKINEHNSGLQSKQSKLDKIEYKEGKGWNNKFFEQIPKKLKDEISKKIDENPTEEYYTIFNNFFRYFKLK